MVKDASSRVKIVVALYPFKAIEGGDLSLEKVFVSGYNKTQKNCNHCITIER